MTELLLQHGGKLPVHLLVSSGVAILEADPVPRQLLLSDGATLDIFADKLCNLDVFKLKQSMSGFPHTKCTAQLPINIVDSAGSMDHQVSYEIFL